MKWFKKGLKTSMTVLGCNYTWTLMRSLYYNRIHDDRNKLPFLKLIGIYSTTIYHKVTLTVILGNIKNNIPLIYSSDCPTGNAI